MKIQSLERRKNSGWYCIQGNFCPGPINFCPIVTDSEQIKIVGFLEK